MLLLRRDEVRVTAAEVQSSPWAYPLIISAVSAVSVLLGVLVNAWSVGRKKAVEHEDVLCRRFRRFFENTPAALIVDRSLTILNANKRARLITGYGTDLEGMSVYSLIPTEHREIHRGHVKRFFSDPIARRMGSSRGATQQEFPLLTRSGEIVMVDISLAPMEDDFGGQEVAVGIDPIRL